MVRSAVIGIKESDYFTAAQAVGTPTRVTLVRHLLPNIMAPIIIIFSINVGGVIIAEASLSFLGFGLPAGVPSWGGMLSREGRSYMEIAPWLAIWPGVFLDRHRLQPEHVRRRAQGPAGPPAPGRPAASVPLPPGRSNRARLGSTRLRAGGRPAQSARRGATGRPQMSSRSITPARASFGFATAAPTRRSLDTDR